jgi:cytochrome bd-type quinol oxidase subunit 2
MNTRKFIIAALATSLLAAPTFALAFNDNEAKDKGFNSLTEFTNSFKGVQNPGNLGLIDTIINIVNALLVLAAVAAIIFVILGGVRYITAQGDEDAVEQAKNTIIYAIIGLIVIMLAAVIVNFVLQAVI